MEDQYVDGVDNTVMNPALVFDQEDREGPRSDDHEDREDSSVESLHILVDDCYIGTEGKSIEIRKKQAVSKFRKMVMRGKNKIHSTNILAFIAIALYVDGVDNTVMNPALVFDQEDREGPRSDDHEDREDSSVESLHILVDDCYIGTEGKSIEIRKKQAVSKFRKMVMRGKNKIHSTNILAFIAIALYVDGVDNTVMNPALVFDQEDREGPRSDDHEDREDSSVESLHILVDDCYIGTEGKSIEIRKKQAVSKFRKMVMRGKNKIHSTNILAFIAIALIKNVLYTPKLNQNVLSMNLLTKQGFEISFQGAVCYIIKPLHGIPVHEKKSNENSKDVKEYVTKERKSNIHLKDVDNICEYEHVWKHFEEMDLEEQKIKRMIDNEK
ncbi:hypothetical protein E3N88_22470 [Mikania micrantha]|uniref:Uncharacterized protein n=1 Tax=Mikania micrantha TaxID=192012 RepID=A0A5N6NBM6_9ASTR|nr:hypothetical protein E3N88_22470 [Mikania micrantha]